MEFTTLEVFLRAIWDNLAQRPFNPLEAARVLFTLRQKCGVKDQALIEQFLPMLGLSPHGNVLQSYLGLHQLHAELRRLVKEGHLTLASAERLSREAPDAQARMAPLWSSIRLTASLQRELLDLAEDLAAISGATPSGVLADPEILSITRDAGLSGYQKGQKIHGLLYRRRNPRLSMARDAFLAEKSRLNLPGSVRLSPDPFFERPRLRVEWVPWFVTVSRRWICQSDSQGASHVSGNESGGCGCSCHGSGDARGMAVERVLPAGVAAARAIAARGAQAKQLRPAEAKRRGRLVGRTREILRGAVWRAADDRPDRLYLPKGRLDEFRVCTPRQA